MSGSSQTIGLQYSPAYKQPAQPDSNLVTNHSVTLTNLNPNYSYNIEVASVDASGNAASSGQFDAGGNYVGGFVTFSTQNVNTTAPLDFRIIASGPTNVFAGSDLYSRNLAL